MARRRKWRELRPSLVRSIPHVLMCMQARKWRSWLTEFKQLLIGQKLGAFNVHVAQPAHCLSRTFQQLPYPDWCRIPDGAFVHVLGCDQAPSTDGGGLGGWYQRPISRVAEGKDFDRGGTDGADGRQDIRYRPHSRSDVGP